MDNDYTDYAICLKGWIYIYLINRSNIGKWELVHRKIIDIVDIIYHNKENK